MIKHSFGMSRVAMWVIAITIGLPLLYSCASIGNPSGGPIDEDPPAVVSSNPPQGSINFKGQRVDISFNELVNVKDAFTNVVVSPPQASVPKVLASGRNIIVQWDEDLLPETTYTIDFGSAIEDVNEGNPLGNYSFSFSTGNDIDSLRISGIVLDAATLEPQQGMIVGVHRADAPDSAFRTLRFDRATKTDDRGRFTLRGLKNIAYNVFALGDLNNDYRWDNPAEILGFYPNAITPYTENGMASDTIFNLKTGTVDTVVNRNRTVFLPNNLLISVFDIGYKPQYLVKYERPDSARLSFIFNSKASSLPTLSFPEQKVMDDWCITEYSADNDTVTYWLRDKHLIQADTIRVAVSYMRTGTNQSLQNGIDTLTLIRPKIKSKQKQGHKNSKQLAADSIAAEKEKWISINPVAGNILDIYAPLQFEVSEPLISIDEDMIHLEQMVDSTWTTIKTPGLRSDVPGKVRRFKIDYPWAYGGKYRLTIDSTAVEGISGRPNATFNHEFSVKRAEEYASLTLRLVPDTIKGYVEVLSTSDKPVAVKRVVDGTVTFPYLQPADYYARFIQTSDSIMEFHPGNYDQRIQPDEVYYFPKMLSLKRYDRSEQWVLNNTPVDLQKPEAIKKNKPVNKKARRTKEDDASSQNEEDDYFDVTRNPFDNKPAKTSKR